MRTGRRYRAAVAHFLCTGFKQHLVGYTVPD